MAAVTVCSDFGAQENKICHCFQFFSTYLPWSDGTRFHSVQFSSIAQSCPTLCDPMNCSMPGLPVPSPTPGVHSDSRPLSRWCHPAISSSVILFSSCPQSLPASESFPMSQLFAWSGQSIGVSALASFLPKNTQGWPNLKSNLFKTAIKYISWTLRSKRNHLKLQISNPWRIKIEWYWLADIDAKLTVPYINILGKV